MFKTRKFQSWATSLPLSAFLHLFLSFSCSLYVSLSLYLSPSGSISFALCLLFVYFLLQLRHSTNSAKLSACHKARSVPLPSPLFFCLFLFLSLCHTLALADIRLPEKTHKAPACQTYLFSHKLLHKQAQCNFNQFYGTFICQAPEHLPHLPSHCQPNLVTAPPLPPLSLLIAYRL